MADSTVALLTAASALDGTELLYAVQGGADRKATPAQVKTYIGSVKVYSASSDPGASNDNTQGYAAGSVGINTSTGRNFVLRDASTGAAKWELVGSVNAPSYLASQWFAPPFMTGTPVAGTARVSGTIYCFPIFIFERVTLHALAVRITTLDGGAVGAQLALYNNSATNRPGTKVANLGSAISLASAASVSGTLSADQQIERGWYWLALQTNSTTALFNSFTSGTSSPLGMFMGSATLGEVTGSTTMAVGVSTTGTYAADGTGMGDLTGATFTALGGTNVPVIYHQVQSFP